MLQMDFSRGGTVTLPDLSTLSGSDPDQKNGVSVTIKNTGAGPGDSITLQDTANSAVIEQLAAGVPASSITVDRARSAYTWEFDNTDSANPIWRLRNEYDGSFQFDAIYNARDTAPNTDIILGTNASPTPIPLAFLGGDNRAFTVDASGRLVAQFDFAAIHLSAEVVVWSQTTGNNNLIQWFLEWRKVFGATNNLINAPDADNIQTSRALPADAGYNRGNPGLIQFNVVTGDTFQLVGWCSVSTNFDSAEITALGASSEAVL